MQPILSGKPVTLQYYFKKLESYNLTSALQICELIQLLNTIKGHYEFLLSLLRGNWTSTADSARRLKKRKSYNPRIHHHHHNRARILLFSRPSTEKKTVSATLSRSLGEVAWKWCSIFFMQMQ
eukprot:GEZU01025094.1.p1 GENE.GEZU01025094.1~~GEZU01025094.1.p1  ORF type:complete len:123 (+),score=1.38 GEZU01025094.1:415-783(+)